MTRRLDLIVAFFVGALACLMLCSMAGCSPFAGAAAGMPNPPPNPPPPPPAATNPSQHALSLAIYGGLLLAFGGILLAIIAGRVRTGVLLIAAGIATWALAEVVRQYEKPIVITAGCLSLAAVLWGAWEAWQHRTAAREIVAGFNQVKTTAPDLWGRIKAKIPPKSPTAERVVKGMGG